MLDLPREQIIASTSQPRPISKLAPILFSSLSVVALATWRWPIRWLISGTPILSLCILLGASNGHRIAPIVPLWPLVTILNLAYTVAATSWLLYIVFSALVYPAIFITCLFQFDTVARITRRSIRNSIGQLHLVNDTIALFDLPALEIDVDVDGLMEIRGLTISLSTLTVVAHGVEVGIKLSDDMELAISVEKVTVALFRRVEIGDCFANIKGGHHEMTFGELEDTSEKDEDGDAVMVEATPLLQAAAAGGVQTKRPKIIKMKSKITGGAEMKNSGVQASLDSIKAISPEDRHAAEQYDEMLKWIEDSNLIQKCRKEVLTELSDENDGITDIRAAICSKMHSTPSVPHPPKRSIKVTTLQNLSSPRQRRFLHRLPMLLRLLLTPITYLHTVTISSITAGGSGEWISYLLLHHLFKDYGQDNRQLRKLEKRILSWLADANFVFQLADITGVASVPFLTAYDVTALLKIGDVIAYRASRNPTSDDGDDVPAGEKSPLEEVIRLGGADASFAIPSYLLPHHEHILPPKPSTEDRKKLEDGVDQADGKPKEVQAERRLEQAEEDEANVKISAHVQLPACFSQELLNFIAALVKASKVVELEKEPGLMEAKVSGFKEFGHALSKGMRDSMKKTVVDGIVNDKWIAKMVGKVTRQLEAAQGDVGYSGDIPVKLKKYRLPEGHPEMNKLLP